MFRSELRGNPGNLSNEDIKNLGQLHMHDKYSVPLFKKNANETAESMATYDEENPVQDKWMFIANCYGALSAGNALLAVDIRKLYITAFKIDDSLLKRAEKFHTSTFSGMMKRKIVDYFVNKKNIVEASNDSVSTLSQVESPRSLTNEDINAIGTLYLKNFGDKPSFFSGLFHLHTNHLIAKKLIDCSQDNCKDRWLFLLRIYEDLPNNRGVIAKQIRKYFVDAFKPGTYELEDVPFMSKTSDITKVMKTLITNHFETQPLHLPDIHPLDGLSEMVESGKKYAGKMIVKSAFSSMGFN